MSLPPIFRHALLVFVLASLSLVSPLFAGPSPFSLGQSAKGESLRIFVDPASGAPVSRAARDLASDIAKVTGQPEPLVRESSTASGTCIIVGRLGAGGLVDRLAASKKIEVRPLQGAWEAGLRTVVERPFPGVERALVIAGSDVRGTIYALYSVSEDIGVSPWYWWADVPVKANPEASLAAETKVLPAPAVQYRGIFINDEDWGLHPWAAKVFEPEAGGLGPKTYARICELLLRLGANTLWPAMHACSPAFNANPENARVAARYGILMGSSHAEPMLRNNVREWTADPHAYDYTKNREAVLRYWEQRVQENGRYENIYTIGMRGIHDSAMQGVKTVQEQKRFLEQIFADQRQLLAKHVSPNPERVPQIFCAYKEVLEVYRTGLKVPEDVTIVWPDDNFGYIRNFPSEAERARAGGTGVYYHISYLGRPLSYLWLNTASPALIWSEMSKAYELGARKLWIVNVGDIKPGEIGMEFFLRLAREAGTWGTDAQLRFLRSWAAREFGADNGEAVAQVMNEFYRLNFQRKPEHLQWWLPGKAPVASPLSPAEKQERLLAFKGLQRSAEEIALRLPLNAQDAFFQLVLYPVRGSAAANERFFCNEEYQRLKDSQPAEAAGFAARAQRAHEALLRDTDYFNTKLAGGKWMGLMSLEPADTQWKSMRIAPPSVPEGQFTALEEKPLEAFSPRRKALPPSLFIEKEGVISIEASHFTAKNASNKRNWEIIPGLGRSGAAVTVLPVSAEAPEDQDIPAQSPRLEYAVRFDAAGTYTLQVQLLPTHPLLAGKAQRLALCLDVEEPLVLKIPPHDGTAEWSQGVLNATRKIETKLSVKEAGNHILRIYGPDAGLCLDKIILVREGKQADADSYLGPKETGLAVSPNGSSAGTPPAPVIEGLQTQLVALSPAGNQLAYGVRGGKNLELVLRSLPPENRITGRVGLVELPDDKSENEPRLSWLEWFGEQRLVFAVSTGARSENSLIFACDGDGSKMLKLASANATRAGGKTNLYTRVSPVCRVAGTSDQVLITKHRPILTGEQTRTGSESFEDYFVIDVNTGRETPSLEHEAKKMIEASKAERRTTRAEWPKIDREIEVLLPGMKIDIIGSDTESSRVLFLAQNIACPGTYHVLDRKTQKAYALLARGKTQEAAGEHLSSHFEVSNAEGLKLTGLLVLPPSAKTLAAPLVVFCPAKTSERALNDYRPEIRTLADAGFAVAVIEGYAASNGGRIKVDDKDAPTLIAHLFQGIDHLGKTFPVDPKRVALLSEFHGTQLALRAIQTQPQRFQAAIFLAPLASLGTWDKAAKRQAGVPDKNLPVLLAATGKRQTWDYAAALDAQGLKTELLPLERPYKRENHPDNAELYQRITTFLNQHLFHYDVQIGVAQPR